jgi:hypothetical protein
MSGGNKPRAVDLAAPIRLQGLLFFALLCFSLLFFVSLAANIQIPAAAARALCSLHTHSASVGH